MSLCRHPRIDSQSRGREMTGRICPCSEAGIPNAGRLRFFIPAEEIHVASLPSESPAGVSGRQATEVRSTSTLIDVTGQHRVPVRPFGPPVTPDRRRLAFEARARLLSVNFTTADSGIWRGYIGGTFNQQHSRKYCKQMSCMDFGVLNADFTKSTFQPSARPVRGALTSRSWVPGASCRVTRRGMRP